VDVRGVLTEAKRRELSRENGNALKVLLTLYRWSRPYFQVPYKKQTDARWYEYQATARLFTDDLTRQVMAIEGGTDVLRKERHAIQESLRSLRRLGLVRTLTDHGRGRSSIYVTHAITPVLNVPSGLWRAGGIAKLSGTELFVLLRVLARVQAARPAGPYAWRRASRSTRLLAQLGTLFVPTSQVAGTDIDDRVLRRGLESLERHAVVARLAGRPWDVSRSSGIPFWRSLDPESPSASYHVLLDPNLVKPLRDV
jgi:hypothetical protein